MNQRNEFTKGFQSGKQAGKQTANKQTKTWKIKRNRKT